MFDTRFVQWYRDGVFLGEGYGTWADNRPPAFCRRLQTGPSFPRHIAARFASGVSELDAGSRSLCFQKPRNARQRFDVLVFPDSHVTWRNASIGGDRGSLDDHQTNSAHGPTPEVDQVKIIGEAVVSRIHAHWRHRDSVAENKTPNCHRGK